MPAPLPVHIADEPNFWLTYVVPWISAVAAVVISIMTEGLIGRKENPG
jgi:hypothetical protein